MDSTLQTIVGLLVLALLICVVRDGPCKTPMRTDWTPPSCVTYILDEHGQPVACDDPLEWAVWMAEHPDRRVAQDMDEGEGTGRVHVSTVFLGVDSGIGTFFGGPPLLWETMVFGGGVLDHLTRRYASRDEALAGHQEVCAEVSATIHRQEGR
jgi:hypothetical protein